MKLPKVHHHQDNKSKSNTKGTDQEKEKAKPSSRFRLLKGKKTERQTTESPIERPVDRSSLTNPAGLDQGAPRRRATKKTKKSRTKPAGDTKPLRRSSIKAKQAKLAKTESTQTFTECEVDEESDEEGDWDESDEEESDEEGDWDESDEEESDDDAAAKSKSSGTMRLSGLIQAKIEAKSRRKTFSEEDSKGTNIESAYRRRKTVSTAFGESDDIDVSDRLKGVTIGNTNVEEACQKNPFAMF